MDHKMKFVFVNDLTQAQKTFMMNLDLFIIKNRIIKNNFVVFVSIN